MNYPDLGVLVMGKVGFLLCTKGAGSVIINGKSFELKRGNGTVISPILIVNVKECDEDFTLLPMVCKLEYMISNAQKIFSSGFPIMVLQHPVVTLSEEDFQLVMMRHTELEQLEQQKSRDNGCGILSRIFEQSALQLMSSTFMSLIGKYYADYINQIDTPNSASTEWQMAARFLLSLIAPGNNERQVSRYADQAHLSVGHFSAKVRQTLGMSPQQWIEMITINKAKSMLQQRGKSIKEIARELGFPEQFTFRKYFKQHAGMSPTDYRTSRD